MLPACSLNLRVIQNTLKTELKYARVLGRVYGTMIDSFPVSFWNSAIYPHLAVVADMILEKAIATATGNHNRSPRLNTADATATLPGFARKGRQMVRAENSMKPE